MSAAESFLSDPRTREQVAADLEERAAELYGARMAIECAPHSPSADGWARCMRLLVEERRLEQRAQEVRQFGAAAE